MKRSWLCMLRLLPIVAAQVASSVAQQRGPIVVVGGGLAGLSAALEAVAHDVSVILLESEARLGGNSAKATSGINGAQTTAQFNAGVQDSLQQFAKDTIMSGRGLSDEALVHTLAAESADALRFLEAAGLDLGYLIQLGGHSTKRTHREPNSPDGKPRPVGFDIVNALRKKLDSLPPGLVTVLTNAKAQRLLVKPASGGRVDGVEFLNLTDNTVSSAMGQAVILATGGYSADRQELLAQHAPQLLALPTTNGPWARGDGIRLGRAVGAHPIHMDKVQVHPTAFVDPADVDGQVKFLAPEALRGLGGVLLNARGQRFVDELAPRDTVTGAIFKHAPLSEALPETVDMTDQAQVHTTAPRSAEAYLVLDEKAVAGFGPNFDFYFKVKHFFQKVEGPSGVAEAINARRQRRSLSPLASGAQVFAALAMKRGKTGAAATDPAAAVPADEAEALYVAAITPAIHYTMGGLQIRPDAAVLRAADSADEKPRAIAGLYAAGEVSGGLHGANRLGGNSLLECVVFGRIAARSAIRNHVPKSAEEQAHEAARRRILGDDIALLVEENNDDGEDAGPEDEGIGGEEKVVVEGKSPEAGEEAEAVDDKPTPAPTRDHSEL